MKWTRGGRNNGGVKKKELRTRLNRDLVLLDLAGENSATAAMIRWESREIGDWEKVNPKWRVLGARIRFQFQCDERGRERWIASVKSKPWGMRVELTDDVKPVPEILDILWKNSPDCSGGPSPGLWEIVRLWLDRKFPYHRIVHAGKRPCLAHTLSGMFLRVVFRHGEGERYLIAAGENAGDESDKGVGQALVWLSTLRGVGRGRSAPAVDVLVPSGTAAPLCHRSRLLNRNRVRMEVWEYWAGGEEMEFSKVPVPPSPEENKDYRWPVLGPFRWSDSLERVLNLAPELIRRYPRFLEYDSLRLWGLEFAQVMGAERDRICFGIGPQRTELNDGNFESLRALVEEIRFFRRPDSPDPRHPCYRLQAERWLEALMLEQVPHLFPEMAPESVYSQIPVYLGKDSGRIDILGADRQGTLVVIELKVTADPDLPVQALDYWGRVIRHNENGDFERRGYFSEIRLNRRRPKIYLVSPIFSFHDTTERLLRYLDPELEVWKISINEDWRCGVKIVRRVRYRCKELN